MKLNEKQLEFLHAEFGLTEEAVDEMTADGWMEVREKCFEIETDELLDMHYAGKDIDKDEWTERCHLAVSIVDAKFSQERSGFERWSN